MARIIRSSQDVTRRWLIAAGLSLGVGSLSLPASAEGASVEEATRPQIKKAAKAYADGVKAMQAKLYDDALAAFQESYAIVRSPNSRLMIGRALVELGRLGSAWDEFRNAKREAAEVAEQDKKYAQTAQAAEAELQDLEKRVGFVLVNVRGRGPARIIIEGRERAEHELTESIAVAPGTVRVELLPANGPRIERQPTVSAGETVNVDLSSPEPPAAEVRESAEPQTAQGRNTQRTLAYVATGAGVVGLVTFGVFGTLTNSRWRELENACQGRVCPTELEDDADAGQTYQTIANLGLVVGVVGLGAGVTLLLLSEDEGREKPIRHGRLRLGPGSVNLSGSF